MNNFRISPITPSYFNNYNNKPRNQERHDDSQDDNSDGINFDSYMPQNTIDVYADCIPVIKRLCKQYKIAEE